MKPYSFEKGHHHLHNSTFRSFSTWNGKTPTLLATGVDTHLSLVIKRPAPSSSLRTTQEESFGDNTSVDFMQLPWVPQKLAGIEMLLLSPHCSFRFISNDQSSSIFIYLLQCTSDPSLLKTSLIHSTCTEQVFWFIYWCQIFVSNILIWQRNKYS